MTRRARARAEKGLTERPIGEKINARGTLSMNPLDKLCAIGGDRLAPGAPSASRLRDAFGEEATAALASLLDRKNGFYAFESALHVRGEGDAGAALDVVAWNAPELWRADYAGGADRGVFFAEDVFGAQFCWRDGEVWSFDPETGAYEVVAPTMHLWARRVLEEYAPLTGQPLAHEWQMKNGPLVAGERLVPKRPFVLGGEYAVDNLRARDAVEGMRFRASIAVQIRDLPDGTRVKLRVIE